MIRVTYTCVKVVFQNKQLAVQRANEINAEDSVKKKGYKFLGLSLPYVPQLPPHQDGSFISQMD